MYSTSMELFLTDKVTGKTRPDLYMDLFNVKDKNRRIYSILIFDDLCTVKYANHWHLANVELNYDELPMFVPMHKHH